MANKRTPRKTETREAEARPSDSWLPSSVLPTPDDQDGYSFRWIRTAMFDKADPKNVSKRFREGWEPVKASEHPELMVMSDIDSRFPESVEIGGLLLCKAPTERVEARNRYYQERAEAQMAAVDQNFMRENDPRMPLLNPERTSRTEFGKG